MGPPQTEEEKVRKKLIVSATTYFGPVEWYAHIVRSDGSVYIEAHENFVKQTTRNHCRIVTANGVQKLSVPVTLSVEGKTTIGKVKVSDHGNWRHQHWEALCSAYGMSPFFEYYADDIHPFFTSQWENLLDFNMAIMQKIFSLIGIEKEIKLTDSYQGITPMPEDITLQPYYQTFQRRHGFIPGMSILDLLFNEGPAALLILKDSYR